MAWVNEFSFTVENESDDVAQYDNNVAVAYCIDNTNLELVPDCFKLNILGVQNVQIHDNNLCLEMQNKKWPHHTNIISTILVWKPCSI